MIGWLTSRLGAFIGGALVALLVFAVQEFRLSRVQQSLIACQDAQADANAAVLAAIEKGREEGRVAAIADGERLRAAEAERATALEKQIADLKGIAARLNAPRPPIAVTATSEPPIVVTPPVASCALDRTALDDLRAFLNRSRGP